MFQLRRHQLGRGGRWRRSRHLRRVQRPRQGGMEMISFPYRNRFKFPFLRVIFFLKIRMNSVQNRSKNGQRKSRTDRHTNRQDRADPEHRRDRALDSQKSDTARRWLKKLSPNPSLNPAKIPVKEHLRLASVVALSSSGACGAIMIFLKRCNHLLQINYI